MQSLLLFGGSFDPVHNGHIALLQAALRSLNPDHTLVIPAGNPWQKAERTLAEGTHRLAMLRAAVAALPGVSVDDRELHRAGATYAIDTLLELSAAYPNHAMAWLLGSDAFARLHTWHRADEVVQLTNFVVASRAGETIHPPPLSLRETGFKELRSVNAAQWARLDVAPPPTSSTMIRDRVRRGQSISDAAPSSVCEYIQSHHLYR